MCACITLKEMGKRDDSSPRTTREFDSARLAALTKQPLVDKPASSKADPDYPDVEDEDLDKTPLQFGRAPTIDDPLTTGLLAEVTRRSQTVEFDDDTIQGVLERIDSGDTSHPHTRRRTAK